MSTAERLAKHPGTMNHPSRQYSSKLSPKSICNECERTPSVTRHSTGGILALPIVNGDCSISPVNVGLVTPSKILHNSSSDIWNVEAVAMGGSKESDGGGLINGKMFGCSCLLGVWIAFKKFSYKVSASKGMATKLLKSP